MVGVNSNMIRAVRVVMDKPGLTYGKISILVGGPDWPTYVMTGILKLDYWPIFMGTLPCVVLIVPTVLSGMFIYLAGPPNSFGWATTVGTVCTAATGLAQGGAMLSAAFYLEKAMVDEKEAIDALPLDEEVVEADRIVEERNRVFAEETKWEKLPTWVKYLLSTALVLMIISVWQVMVFTNSCFELFEMADTIEDALNGDAMSLVKPMGWVSIGLFVTSSLLLCVFNKWAGGRVALAQKNSPQYGGMMEVGGVNEGEVNVGVEE